MDDWMEITFEDKPLEKVTFIIMMTSANSTLFFVNNRTDHLELFNTDEKSNSQI